MVSSTSNTIQHGHMQEEPGALQMMLKQQANNNMVVKTKTRNGLELANTTVCRLSSTLRPQIVWNSACYVLLACKYTLLLESVPFPLK